MAKTADPKASESKASAAKTGKKVKAKRPVANKYTDFMKTRIAELKDSMKEVTHKERFKAAAADWKNSPMNPKSAKYVPEAKATA